MTWGEQLFARFAEKSIGGLSCDRVIKMVSVNLSGTDKLLSDNKNHLRQDNEEMVIARPSSGRNRYISNSITKMKVLRSCKYFLIVCIPFGADVESNSADAILHAIRN